MKISVLGLGYVGAVCTACLADQGHAVTGVDVSEFKVDRINQGKSPIVEPGLEELLEKGVRSNLIRATTNVHEAVLETDLSMICVGTPSKKNGDLDLTYVENVCRDIGRALRAKDGYHVIVVRSTVLPGTVRELVIPILEDCSGKRAGTDFGVAMNPEFLRESTAINDYRHPPMTVIGELDARSGDMLEAIYAPIDAPLLRKPIEVAEMVKYTCNVWHAVKVSFANEIGNIAKAHGVDGREVMDIVCHDHKLNLSRYYMRPGFAFGGSCLPKDVRALTYRATQKDVNHPLLSSIMRSNTSQVRHALDLATRYNKRNIGLLGLSFKAGTDDLRESPLVELAERLIGKGYTLRIFDRNVRYAHVHGSNREYIESRIPHLASLLHENLDDVIQHSDVIIIGNNDDLFRRVVETCPEDKQILDLVGLMSGPTRKNLEGICW